MSNVKIEADMIQEQIGEELKLYNKEVIGEIKKITRESMKTLVKKTKAQRFKQDHNKFRSAIASRIEEEAPGKLIMQWYVKPPYYRLAHLLEDGHQLNRGGRTVAYKFISRATEEVEKDHIEKIEEVLKNG